MAQSNQITSTNYPFLRIVAQSRSWQHETLALIDTGFDGALAVPLSVVETLGDPDTSTDWQQADGSIAEAPVYYGAVQIVNLAAIPELAIIALGNEYILGREILDRFEIILDHGQRVIVRP